MQYQLKRYKIRATDHDAFLEMWRRVVVMRKKHGFVVLFAVFDRETGWFTWAIGHDDLAAAAEQYYADPGRVALDNIVDYVEDHDIRTVDRIEIP